MCGHVQLTSSGAHAMPCASSHQLIGYKLRRGFYHHHLHIKSGRRATTHYRVGHLPECTSQCCASKDERLHSVVLLSMRWLYSSQSHLLFTEHSWHTPSQIAAVIRQHAFSVTSC